MPPTKSIISECLPERPSSFGDRTGIISKDSTSSQESASPSDEAPRFSSQFSPGHSSRLCSAPPTIHTFALPAGTNSIPLMTVNLHSWASSSTTTPSFVEGQCISGQVQLNLRRPDRVKAVLVSVEGYYSIPGHEAKTFLQVSETLWDSTMGDPRSSGTFVSQDTDRPGKLQGKYSWSFKINFPKTVEMSEKRADSQCGERLPPSLRGTHGQARIGYEMVVRIKRHGFRFGNSLTIPITYMTSTRPCSVSVLRRLACQDTTAMSSFFDDPSGWKLFPEFQVDGSCHRAHTSFACTLALSSPLSYTRGSLIPCVLVISSSDQRILEATSSPSAPQVFLRQRLVLYSKLGGELVLDGQEKIISKARWRTMRGASQMLPPFRKFLQGEISIPPTTTPSFIFANLELKYDILVFAFDLPAFIQAESGPLICADVAITSFNADGASILSQVS